MNIYRGHCPISPIQVLSNMSEKLINYSQCWEDPEVLTKALAINETDSVLSISSGGDNTLFLLSLSPRKIVSIDLNPVQNYLLELKLAALTNLSHHEILAFLGIEESKNRLDTYRKLSVYLTPAARLWWSTHSSFIESGIINAGQLEKFLTIFRKYFLPLIHSNKTISEFVSTKTLKEQQEFYASRWNSKRWRLYFRFASSRFMLQYFARQKGSFTHVQAKKVAGNYLDRLEMKLNNVLLSSNYFMNYCLTGSYGQTLPPYLEEKNLALYKRNLTSLEIVTRNVVDYLKSLPESTVSKFNLSDIFESLSPSEIEKLWEEIIRTAKKGAVVVFWDNLMTKPLPSHVSGKIKAENQLASELFVKDKVFFYSDFHVYKISK